MCFVYYTYNIEQILYIQWGRYEETSENRINNRHRTVHNVQKNRKIDRLTNLFTVNVFCNIKRKDKNQQEKNKHNIKRYEQKYKTNKPNNNSKRIKKTSKI